MSTRTSSQRLFLAILLLSSQAMGNEPRSMEITDPIDFESSPINYFAEDTTDAITELKSRIERGEVRFKSRESSGYLLDMLDALGVSVSSQTLVFSRTSLQHELINPKNPRAIYFNDEVAVGWIPGAPVLELVAQDPIKGAVFFTVPQPAEGVPEGAISFHREARCTECHVAASSLNVPGYMIRSIEVDEVGERDPQGLSFEVTHRIGYEKRWGGWYVTGRAPKMIHVGNLFGEDEVSRHEQDKNYRGAMMDLSSLVDLSQYPSSQSDIVALSVLDHQCHFYNLVTRVQYEHRVGRRSDAEEQLARYAMMEDEAPLAGPVIGSTEYASWYQSNGPRDSQGRSLRDLNLSSRLFEHRLSPLVMSKAFQALPEDVKSRLWERIRKTRSDSIDLDWVQAAQSVNSPAPGKVVRKPIVATNTSLTRSSPTLDNLDASSDNTPQEVGTIVHESRGFESGQNAKMDSNSVPNTCECGEHPGTQRTDSRSQPVLRQKSKRREFRRAAASAFNRR